jgi:bifunctional enzyme CysN/CysC
MVRGLVAETEFIEIFVDTPMEVCMTRDPKGLYAKAKAGELANFTGIDSPYEAPESPDIRLDTTNADVEAQVDRIIRFLAERGAG